MCGKQQHNHTSPQLKYNWQTKFPQPCQSIPTPIQNDKLSTTYQLPIKTPVNQPLTCHKSTEKYFQTSSTQNLYPNRFSHAADQSDQYIYPYPEILMLLLMFKNRPTEGKLRWLRFKLLYFFNSTSTVVNGLVHLSAHILCSQCNDQILLLHA